MSLVIVYHFLRTQHVSHINIPIIRSLWLRCWTTTSVVLFLVRCVLEIWCGRVSVVSVLWAEAQVVLQLPCCRLKHKLCFIFHVAGWRTNCASASVLQAEAQIVLQLPCCRLKHKLCFIFHVAGWRTNCSSPSALQAEAQIVLQLPCCKLKHKLCFIFHVAGWRTNCASASVLQAEAQIVFQLPCCRLKHKLCFSLQHGHYSNPATPTLQHTTNREQYDWCGNSTAQSQAPDDGYINFWNMLST